MLPDSGVLRNMAELMSIVQWTRGSKKRQTSSSTNTQIIGEQMSYVTVSYLTFLCCRTFHPDNFSKIYPN